MALLTKDLAAGWVLELVHRYPAAPLLAQAAPADLAAIAYLPDTQVTPLLEHARTSVGSLAGEAAAELVREQVRQLRDAGARQKRLENLLVSAYEQLPDDNHLATIPGIGKVTAAVLTAFVLDSDRFATPGKLVAYFGILPVEVSGGVTRDGQARAASGDARVRPQGRCPRPVGGGPRPVAAGGGAGPGADARAGAGSARRNREEARLKHGCAW